MNDRSHWAPARVCVDALQALLSKQVGQMAVLMEEVPAPPPKGRPLRSAQVEEAAGRLRVRGQLKWVFVANLSCLRFRSSPIEGDIDVFPLRAHVEHVKKEDPDELTWRDYQIESVSANGAVATIRGPLGQ